MTLKRVRHGYYETADQQFVAFQIQSGANRGAWCVAYTDAAIVPNNVGDYHATLADARRAIIAARNTEAIR